jgi:hypothetical protein
VVKTCFKDCAELLLKFKGQIIGVPVWCALWAHSNILKKGLKKVTAKEKKKKKRRLKK